MFRDFFGRFARRSAPAIVRRESLDLPDISRRRFILTATSGGAMLLVPKPVGLVSAIEAFEWSGFSASIPRGQLYNELSPITNRAFIPKLYVDIYRSDPMLRRIFLNASAEEQAKLVIT